MSHLLGGGLAEHGWVNDVDTFRSQSIMIVSHSVLSQSEGEQDWWLSQKRKRKISSVVVVQRGVRRQHSEGGQPVACVCKACV